VLLYCVTYDESHYAESHYAETRYAECHHVVCHLTERRGASRTIKLRITCYLHLKTFPL
jgi:hypothetical protein